MAAYNFSGSLRARGYSENTVEEYVRRGNQWLRFLLNRNIIDVLHVPRSEVMAYRTCLIKDGQSNRTVNSKIGTVHMFYKFAVEQNYLEHNPADGIDYLHTTTPDTPRLNDAQVEALKAWFDTLQPNLRAAFYAMYGAGLRVGEAVHLRYSDVFI